MAVLQGQQMTKLRAAQPTVPDPAFVNGTVRCFVEEIALATQTTSDTIEVARLPKGAVPLYGVLSTSVTLATATLAVGVNGTTGKYRAAGVLTATTPEVFGVNAAIGETLGAEEIVFLTIGTASLPASGTLRVVFVYAVD